MNQVVLSLVFLLSTVAAKADVNPPAQVDRAGYENWLGAVGSQESAFTDDAFDWYQAQLTSPLPSAVAADPQKLYIDVDTAEQQTINHENNGDIPTGTTIGFDTYALIPADVDTVLQAKLFGWGKPIGQSAGTTYPIDTVFSSVTCTTSLRWGAGNFQVVEDETGGGVADDLHDSYSLLVRGDATHGYTIFAQFFGPDGNGTTATTAHMSVMMLKPAANGQTEYRQFARQNGQSYAIFGIDFGRKNFGFNASKVRDGETGFFDQVNQLKTTGTIKQNAPAN